MTVATHDILTGSHAFHPATAGHRPGLIARTFHQWRERIRDRDALAALDYRDQRDIGLSRWEIEREMAKPFWQE